MKIVLSKMKNYKRISFIMIKVGEHITLDFLGVKKIIRLHFYEKIFIKFQKAKVELLKISSHSFEPQGFHLWLY